VAVAVDHGTAMQVALEEVAAVAVQHQTELGQIITRVPMTAVIRTWADEGLPDKDFREVPELDSIVKAKTVIKQVVAAVLAALDTVPKMTSNKD
jgi:hypothetical protein